MKHKKPRTEFAGRIQQAIAIAGLNQTSLARTLSAKLGRSIKPQTIQYLASAATESALTADIAEVCGVRYPWLAHGTGEPTAKYGISEQPIAKRLTLLLTRVDDVSPAAKSLIESILMWDLAAGVDEKVWAALEASAEALIGRQPPRSFRGMRT